jgi:hypothetical protein
VIDPVIGIVEPVIDPVIDIVEPVIDPVIDIVEPAMPPAPPIGVLAIAPSVMTATAPWQAAPAISPGRPVERTSTGSSRPESAADAVPAIRASDGSVGSNWLPILPLSSSGAGPVLLTVGAVAVLAAGLLALFGSAAWPLASTYFLLRGRSLLPSVPPA